jgi:dihydropteroate synthase
MGIVNVTPDSFFPASRTVATQAAIDRGREMFELGVDVVDVGGESTRPGAELISESEELQRVLEVVAALSTLGRVSIDTQKSGVARAAVREGATIINDVSASLGELAGELGAGYVGMHRQGTSATMQREPHYNDVVSEVEAFLDDVARRARASQVGELWLDPGIGFGKTVAHNLALLANVQRLSESARNHRASLLIGTSRKRFLGALGPISLEVDERLEGSIATEAWALLHGASMVRVHDAKAAVQLRELIARPVEEVTT